MTKKLKWDELEAEKHYWLCCTENMHAEIVYAVQRAGKPCMELLFPGDNCSQLVTEFTPDVSFFVEVETPKDLGGGWF